MLIFIAGLSGAVIGSVLFIALAQANKAREEAYKAMLALEQFKSQIVMVDGDEEDDEEDEFDIN